jgi:hypothetical protein
MRDTIAGVEAARLGDRCIGLRGVRAVLPVLVGDGVTFKVAASARCSPP